MKEENYYGKAFNDNVFQLCEKIDSLESEVVYWKELYLAERDESNRHLNERLSEAKRGAGLALSLALSVKEDGQGGLTINKEDRKEISKLLKGDVTNGK